MNSFYKNVAHMLESAAEKYPDKIAINFLHPSNQQTIDYQTLAEKARAIAVLLKEYVKPHERVLLIYPPGIDYIVAFFACLYANVIAVPVYPPQNQELANKLQHVIQNSGAVACLSTTGIIEKLKQLRFLGGVSKNRLVKYFVSLINKKISQKIDDNQWLFNNLKWIATDIPLEKTSHFELNTIERDNIAFLQYTSGSTSDPKGVMVTHNNLLTNLAHIKKHFEIDASDRIVIWLPPYHDMGLIGGILQPIYSQATCYLMSPFTFLQKPLLWLKTISDNQGTISGGPNFAYELCADKITDAERSTLDLSSWKLAFTGAEPIHEKTLEKFIDTFSPCGFQRRAFFPCYGLAEVTLMASSAYKNQGPLYENRDNKTLVSSGHVISDHDVLIVDPETHQPVAENKIGEIWISGPCVALGYWNLPEKTTECFKACLADGRGPYYRTGDLAFLKNNELFIMGRLKDLIIIRGRNYYPQDIELSTEDTHPLIRKGSSVAFSITHDTTEKLIIAVEVKRTPQSEEADALRLAVREAIAKEYGVTVDTIIILKNKTLKKTTSGKVRRNYTKQLYLDNKLEDLCPEKPSNDITKWLIQWVSQNRKIPMDKIDTSKNLTMYGVDSINYMEIIADIEKSFSLSLDASIVWQYQTIDAIADYLNHLHPLSTTQKTLTSHGQRALWYLHELMPSSSAYNVYFAAKINHRNIKDSWENIFKNYDILRSTFQLDGDTVIQKTNTFSSDLIEEVDFTQASEAEIGNYLYNEANKPYDLSKGPLARVKIINTQDKPILLFCAHHSVIDYWSLFLLLSGKAHPKPYEQFVEWENQLLSCDYKQFLSMFWRNHLAHHAEPVTLPYDKMPETREYLADTTTFTLNKNLIKISEDHSHTLFTTLLASFYCLLYQYTKQKNITIGVPFSGRTKTEFNDMVGYFVNTLPICCEIDEDTSIHNLTEKLSQILRDAATCQHYPLDLITQEHHGKKLFHILFNYHKPSDDSNNLLDDIQPIEIKPKHTQFDIMVAINDYTDYLDISVTYDKDCYELETIQNFIHQWQLLLTHLLQGRSVSYPREKTFAMLFDEQALKTPDHTAVTFENQSLTYLALSQLSNQFAHYLKDTHHIQRGDFIGVSLEPSIELIIALLGIAKVGAAYIPMDTSYPKERINYMIDDSKPKLILHQVNIADFNAKPTSYSPASGDLAYVIYTSGSTGKPKGVMIEHSALTNFLLSMKDVPGIDTNDKLLAITPISFDISGLELYLPLLSGATLVLVPRSVTHDPELLIEKIEKEKITLMQATPATWQMLLDAHWKGEPHLKALCGGEAMHVTFAHELRRKCKALWNMYGPTETTIWSSCVQIEETTNPITLGTPINNTQFYIYDDELYIGGDGLAHGYLNRPDLTAEKFIIKNNTRLYKTGDVVTLLPNGQIEYKGRSDFQIKIRGFRIELSEIEECLRKHEHVKEAIVHVQEKSIIGYVIPTNENADKHAIKNHLRKYLPDYMVPADICFITEWPKTPNGKIDRNALPKPLISATTTLVSPRNELENQLCAIWQHLLKRETIGIDDNFFDLGGNSLLAAQLVIQTRNLTQKNLALSKFLENPTIRSISEHIQKNTITETNWEKEILLDADIKTTLPIKNTVYQNVLVTGATGFLGAYLIHDLLNSRESLHCYCLIRANDSHAAFEKLKQNLNKYGLWNEDYAWRLHAIVGNLDAQQLGIQPSCYEVLARDIDAIYHNGAVVNFAYTYVQLKAANVTSVKEILKLAAHHKNKPIHYISTFSVTDENKIPTYGYAQSKWVAEKLLQQARHRGFAVTIYRPGRITGDVKTGIVNTQDLIWHMIKGITQLKQAPDITLDIDFTPVNYVSHIIINLSFNPNATQQNYTIVNPHYISLAEIVSGLNNRGFSIETVSLDTWKSNLLNSEGNALLPFIDFLETIPVTTHYDDTPIFNLLDRDLYPCPPSKKLLGLYLNYLLKTDYISCC